MNVVLHSYTKDSVRITAEGRVDPLAVSPTVVPFAEAAEAWLTPATKLVLRA